MMFNVDAADVQPILKAFGIAAEIVSMEELQRYHYERDDPNSKEVRLILHVNLKDASPVVVRFKNEEDVTIELIESQNRFAETLRMNGIPTPYIYTVNGSFAKEYAINGYEVVVTVEAFVSGEIKRVNAEIARKTGGLLAALHNLSEALNCHVDYEVLFDPFTDNDLFFVEAFTSIGDGLQGEQLSMHRNIIERYHHHMRALEALKSEPRYAVQGDISNNNLFEREDGAIGLFDFNRCGDNIPYCDAVMQAVYEARLMEYPDEYGDDREAIILSAFLKGYHEIRPFTDAQRKWFPHLYAIIDAFWGVRLFYDENSLMSAYKRRDTERVGQHLQVIEAIITSSKEMPI